MKPHGSSLNPYAASYIPLSKRDIVNRDIVTENSPKKSIGAHFSETSEHYTYNQPLSIRSTNFNAHHGEKEPIAVASALENHPFHSSLSQHTSEVTEMGLFDKEFDMDLEYLQANFPGISDQCLADVYFANKGDLEAAIDMLSQLESFTVDPESLPDTLDIGDISESGFAADQPPMKMKNIAGDASTSSKS